MIEIEKLFTAVEFQPIETEKPTFGQYHSSNYCIWEWIDNKISA
jgi:hypothetical protein